MWSLPRCKKICLANAVSVIIKLVNKLGIVLIVANLLLPKKLKLIWTLGGSGYHDSNSQYTVSRP